MSGKCLYRLVAIKKRNTKNSKKKGISPTFFTLDKPNMLYVWKPGCPDQEGYMLSADYTNLSPSSKGRMIHYKFIFDGDSIIINKHIHSTKRMIWFGSELWLPVTSTESDSKYWKRVNYLFADARDEDILELRLEGVAGGVPPVAPEARGVGGTPLLVGTGNCGLLDILPPPGFEEVEFETLGVEAIGGM